MMYTALKLVVGVGIFCLSFFTPLTGQNAVCSCPEETRFLVSSIEKRHPGFRQNLRKRKKTYQALVRQTIAGAAAAQNPEQCLQVLKHYLTFFKDGHLNITLRDSTYVPKSERNLTQNLVFTGISDTTAYMRLPTFYKSYWQELDSFYTLTIPQILDYQHLVVDLRNNTGGGERMYNQLLEALKNRYTSPRRVSIIYNRFCASACEQFVLKVSRKRHVHTYGENSFGALAYGNINQAQTPGCGYIFYLPTKRYRRFLKYELVGIPPDYRLEKGKPWLPQILEITPLEK